MLNAYAGTAEGLVRLPTDADAPAVPARALWVDLYRPGPAQVAAVEALGIGVPSLADMEEIEISNRLYHDAGADYITVVIPGLSTSREAMMGPVTFILTPDRLVTVRHHAPRPFETYPERANTGAAGCGTPERVFLGLAEEIVSRLADLLEGAGTVLDTAARGGVRRRCRGRRGPVAARAGRGRGGSVSCCTGCGWRC